MVHDYQTRQGDGFWYWATIHKNAWFFDHVIICSLMINKKRFISNSTNLMNTNIGRVLAYHMGPASKNYITLIEKFFPFMNVFPPQNYTFNLI